jgi:quercetin dioxygenase-like cupin family protein
MLSSDDGTRGLTLADPDDAALTHLAVVGDTYTVLIGGKQTAGRYALIDMLVPAGSGPPPHRHDFEEMFHVLDGEIEVTLRGAASVAGAGETVNVPALAPHSFANRTDAPARLLCMVSPAGLEEYFAEFADRVESRTAAAPDLSDAEMGERIGKAVELAPKYAIEVLAP